MRAQTAARNGGARHICFDVPNSYAIASYELLFVLRPDDMLTPTPLEVSNETDTLLKMLPEDLIVALHENTQRLSDVVMDKGRCPHAWIDGNRLLLGNDNRLIEQNEIDAVVEQLAGFGSDNRAGIERQLHRISAIRNRESEIIGLTLRLGRHVSGNTGIISDLLSGDPTKSILFLGEPGSGKTTVVREVTRLLAERCNVCIVDTSNEIAGDGDIPHPCVGFARRMMVPSLDRQSAVMIECVQNHTPEVMAIDEIGRPTEVEASDDYLDIYDVQGVDFDSSAYTLLPESFNVTDLPDSCPILVDAKFTLSEENKRPAKVALGFTSTEAKEKFYREMARRMASEIEISGAWLIRATHMTTTAISLALSLVFV